LSLSSLRRAAAPFGSALSEIDLHPSMPAAQQKASCRNGRAVPRGLAELARHLARNLLYPK
ncbi:hypothetical protein, partial [Stutzerimonas kunmingensis]|uniref:hypothetical protein n=1 Tax=Stutzerimonas kunmingensis TaxID=1211807 RepID=UPI00289DF95D